MYITLTSSRFVTTCYAKWDIGVRLHLFTCGSWAGNCKLSSRSREVLCVRKFSTEERKLEIRQFGRRLSSSWVGRRPFYEVECQRAACSDYWHRTLWTFAGGWVYGTGTSGRVVYDSSGCCVDSSEDDCRPDSTTEGRVGRVVSALCHHSRVVNDSWVSCVGRRERVYGPLSRGQQVIVGPLSENRRREQGPLLRR